MADETKSASAAGPSTAEAEEPIRTRLRAPRITIDVYQVGPDGSTHVRSVESSAGPAWVVNR